MSVRSALASGVCKLATRQFQDLLEAWTVFILSSLGMSQALVVQGRGLPMASLRICRWNCVSCETTWLAIPEGIAVIAKGSIRCHTATGMNRWQRTKQNCGKAALLLLRGKPRVCSLSLRCSWADSRRLWQACVLRL